MIQLSYANTLIVPAFNLFFSHAVFKLFKCECVVHDVPQLLLAGGTVPPLFSEMLFSSLGTYYTPFYPLSQALWGSMLLF